VIMAAAVCTPTYATTNLAMVSAVWPSTQGRAITEQSVCVGVCECRDSFMSILPVACVVVLNNFNFISLI
jgi:hypothetical protein